MARWFGITLIALSCLPGCGYSTSRYHGDGRIRQVSSVFRTWEVELGPVRSGVTTFTVGGLPPYIMEPRLSLDDVQSWTRARADGGLACRVAITDDHGNEVASWAGSGEALIIEGGAIRANLLRVPSASFLADPRRTYRIELTLQGGPAGVPAVATLYGGNRVTL